jgi:glycosyltransferase involved in cell wall biosynthesis
MLSVVIPAFNESDAIIGTIEDIQKVAHEKNISPCEVIVVDDGSDDDTAEKAKAAGATVVRHPHNAGYGRSLKDGIKIAKYDTIAITDADLTYPFEEIDRLLAEYRKGFDMVVGARTGKHYKESFIKSPLRKVLKFIVEFSTGQKIPDINSGLRVFSKKTIFPYLKHLCNTFSFTTSMTLAYMLSGLYCKYIPIAYHKRVGKTKVKLVKDALRTLQYILQAVNFYNPIKLFLLFSFFSLGISFCCFLAGIILHWTTFIELGIGSFLIALLSVGMGLLADLMRQLLDKDSPWH